ncbi:ABC transporter permease [Vallitalea pronyensis]|uniref:ABC transporter permease n=2 Tax=Vallitalea pronyensis TaxID=1348613 RepID=A0A8J8SJT2_9FIRM|nr:ABC transporter permease [Vallitalea pronyensis]
MQNFLLPIATVFVFLLIWQIAAATGAVPESKLPQPTRILNTFFEKMQSPDPDGSTLIQNALASLKVTLAGLLMGIFLGTPIGLLMGWYKPVDNFVRPLFEIIRPIPPIAWIPLTILWIGVGMFAKVMIIFFSAFIPCILNSYAGIKGTSKTLINVSKTFGATNFEIFYKIGVPSAMPMVFAGMRIAMGGAWGTLVAAELLAANTGLGYMIMMGRQFGRPDIIVLGMVVIGILGYLFTLTFEKIENYIVRGRAEHEK